ncbi:MAG: nuclear transport factor 2 family protein [Defluviicoccus sp.]|nr:nuclear transport factor 2 family protein [Defluviicoccus sp.]
MDEDRRRAIEWDCTRTLTGFVNALDAGDYETMARLMAETGVWVRPGGDAVGPSGLLEAMKSRPRDLIVRHVISNVAIEVIDEDNATGITYLTVYRHRGPPPENGPAPLAGVHMVGVSYNRLVRESGGWRIAEKRTGRTFDAEA